MWDRVWKAPIAEWGIQEAIDWSKIFLLLVGNGIFLNSLLISLYIIWQKTLGTLSCPLTLGFNQWHDSRHDINRGFVCSCVTELSLLGFCDYQEKVKFQLAHGPRKKKRQVEQIWIQPAVCNPAQPSPDYSSRCLAVKIQCECKNNW